MQQYVDVILPLPLVGSFTYRLPEVCADSVQEGSRVVVQFGVKRYYTAIVMRKHTDEPQGDYEIKEVTEVLDAAPIVQPTQLKLWQWIADYYMCPIGEVYKAALPSGLKIESETVIELNDSFVADTQLRDKEQRVLDALLLNPKQRIQQLMKSCNLKQSMQVIKALLDKGAIMIDEAMRKGYKPKSEVHVRLSETYRSAAAIDEAFASLKRATKQQQLLLQLLEKAGYESPDYTPTRELPRSILLKESGMAAAVLNGLIAKGIVETYVVENSRLADDAKNDSPMLLSPLSTHQQQALDVTP